MKLKSLEVQGFKTFPDKTKLEFTSGITAVVGPNGSGKSNISDAIRWVLGEQSAKSLRCSKMEDVIFNGTQQRKKTGYAQVTLSIDNTDRTLPYDGDEVAVTRRFYRSGNSEYLINNTNVRLQDIHELFMDTGLGRDGYSMIGQGKIDSIVSSKSEDRREIFEEAAGISRFRYRKAEAERRLDKTEENLVRLRDILTELEGRVEPLRIQSEKAKAYLTLAEEKRGLEIALWLKTLDKSSQQLREQEDKLSVVRLQYRSVEQALEAVQSESEEIFTQQGQFGAKADALRQKIADAEEDANNKKSEISVLQNDILHNEQNIQRIRNTAKDLQASDKNFEKEIGEKQEKINDGSKQLSAKKAELEKAERSLGALKADEALSGEKLGEINDLIAALKQQSSDERIKYMTASASLQELKERAEGIAQSMKAKSSQMNTLKQIIEDYDGMLRDCAAQYQLQEEELQKKQRKVARTQESCDKQKETAEKLFAESRRLYDRAKLLEDLERNLEGFIHSVKIVMKEKEKGTLSGIHGPVSRVIKTPSQYSVAIEIALGAAMQNIVTETDADAKKAIAYLKSHDGGRATFLPMSVIKGRELSENGLEQCEGFIGTASELCSCEQKYNGILQNLLGRIVVARDLDCATRIAKKYSYRFKIVTLDGQVVNAGGSLTGGSLAKNTGLLGRATEIEQIRKKASAIAEEAKDAKTEWQKQQETLALEQQAIEDCRSSLAKINENKIKITAEQKSRKTELEGAEQAFRDIKSEQDASLKKQDELNSAIQNAKAAGEKLSVEISKNEDLSAVLSGSRNDYIRRRDKLNEGLQELRIAVLTVEKDIAAAENEITNARLRQKEAKDAALRSEDEIKALQKNNREIQQKIVLLTQQQEDQKTNAESLKREIDSLNQQRIALEMRSAKLRRTEREKTIDRENLSGELARLEERRENLQKQYDEITSKLWEEYEMTPREAKKAAADISDQGKAQRRLMELKQKIKSLGTVNLSAIEEYKEVSQRYTFMSEQLGDVEKSKAELLKLISELTKQMREIFIERFNLINENFSATFIELFGGGKASLTLTDPDQVLTTGIEISVEPPGKLVSHIELLSGGEKALVAIALYFAILKVSPSPFCVMDEIEAALDDVNVYRFASYLRRMNAKTQFICITHRRGTMEEADVLYGVTMQDRGISKLLELHAGEIEQKLGLDA